MNVSSYGHLQPFNCSLVSPAPQVMISQFTGRSKSKLNSPFNNLFSTLLALKKLEKKISVIILLVSTPPPLLKKKLGRGGERGNMPAMLE